MRRTSLILWLLLLGYLALRSGWFGIRINDQWRICFRFEGGNAYDVQIVDNH